MKKSFLLVIGCLLITVVLTSENTFGQSDEGKSGTVYSKYGTGLPLLNNTAQEKGMGIIGVSFNDISSPGLHNPAFWSKGIYTRVAANFDFTSYSIKDFSGEGNNSLLNIGSFQAVFPLSKDKLGLSVALFPETRTSYNVNSSQVIPFGTGSTEYFSNRTGTGGITKFEVGLGYKINNTISVGYAPSYSFLTEKENRSVVFIDGRVSSNLTTRSVNGTSFSHRFGLLLNKRSVFSKSDLIQFGASLTLPTNYDATRTTNTRKNVGSASEIVQIGGTEMADVSLPTKVAAGFTYFLNPKFNASAEIQFENWEEAKYEFSNSDEGAFKNRKVIGTGFQYHPYRGRSAKFLSNFKYSAGVTFDSGHLEISNEEVSTLWFSAGLGLVSPNLRTGSSFDLSFQYGLRGTTRGGLVKENIFGINLSVNLTELMFLQRKLN